MSRLLCGGLTTFDLGYLVAELPGRGEKATAGDSYADVGGPAANAAVTAAVLGSATELHTVIGLGAFAGEVRSLLTGYGVDVVDHDPGVDLPVASIWVDGTGERTILSTDNKRSEVRARAGLIDCSEIDALLLDGHYPDLQIALAEAATAADVPIVLDCGRWRPVFSELLPLATDVIMTATFRPPELIGATPEDAIAIIGDKYELSVCAASRGADPILVRHGSGVAEIPVPQVAVVDTTGAGDVLHGAYVHHRYGRGLNAAEAMHRAGMVASASCRSYGARQLTDSE